MRRRRSWKKENSFSCKYFLVLWYVPVKYNSTNTLVSSKIVPCKYIVRADLVPAVEPLYQVSISFYLFFSLMTKKKDRENNFSWIFGMQSAAVFILFFWRLSTIFFLFSQRDANMHKINFPTRTNNHIITTNNNNRRRRRRAKQNARWRLLRHLEIVVVFFSILRE